MSGSWTLKDKTALVTGASSGIGYAAAMELARQGAHLVLLCRNEQKGRDAVSGIAKNSDDQPELLIADLADLDAVEKAVNRFLREHQSLHVLVNNAGAYHPVRELTKHGYERTFAVNHLGPFLLTNLLLEILVHSAPSRIINVSSFNHRFGEVVLDDLNREKRPWNAMKAYSDSKLMNVLFTRELARRLDGTGVTANAIHPGVVGSEFGSKELGWLGFLWPIARHFMRTPEQGADTIVHLATDSFLGTKSGRYWYNRMDREPATHAQDDDVAAELWETSVDLVGLEVTRTRGY